MRKSARERWKPAPNGVPQQLGVGRMSWYVSAADITAITDPLLERMDVREAERLCQDNTVNMGALTQMTAAVALKLGKSKEGMARRIWSIRNRQQRTCGAETAGAILQFFGLDFDHNTPLAHFPSDIDAAREQIVCHYDTLGEPYPFDLEALARQLLRFGIGYVADTSSEAYPVDYWEQLDEYFTRRAKTLKMAPPARRAA